MKSPLKTLPRYSLQILISLLIIVLLVSVYYFVTGIREVRHIGMHPRNPLGIVRNASGMVIQKLGIADVDKIDVWMNFAYIDIAYGLPPDLLEKSLGIVHPKYPNIPLKKYIREK